MAQKPRPEPAAEPDFEQSLQQLEALVARLERGDLPLAEALSVFEQGVSLTRQCHDQLSTAQQRVEILLKEGGASRIEPFTAENGGGND